MDFYLSETIGNWFFWESEIDFDRKNAVWFLQIILFPSKKIILLSKSKQRVYYSDVLQQNHTANNSCVKAMEIK